MRQTLVEASARYLEGDWEHAGKFLDEAMRNGGGSYNSTLLLMRARCFQQRGAWADVVRATGTLLQRVDARGSWLRGQPRMMAVTLGASAAMEMGDGEKALKFYQSCLRNDPGICLVAVDCVSGVGWVGTLHGSCATRHLWRAP